MPFSNSRMERSLCSRRRVTTMARTVIPSTAGSMMARYPRMAPLRSRRRTRPSIADGDRSKARASARFDLRPSACKARRTSRSSESTVASIDVLGLTQYSAKCSTSQDNLRTFCRVHGTYRARISTMGVPTCAGPRGPSDEPGLPGRGRALADLRLDQRLRQPLLVELEAEAGGLAEQDPAVAVDVERLPHRIVAALQAPLRRVVGELEVRGPRETGREVGVGNHADADVPGVRREHEVVLQRHDGHAAHPGDAAGPADVGLQHVEAAAVDQVDVVVQLAVALAPSDADVGRLAGGE